jgi:hypothetical protein
MSRISNLSNLRIPHFNSWKTLWYENDKTYSFLFFRDFQLFQYLKGLFYRLKMITDDFYFENLNSSCFFVKVNIYLYKFQIKKYFLSLFMDQYLIYNFLLKKRTFLYKFPFFFSSLFFCVSTACFLQYSVARNSFFFSFFSLFTIGSLAFNKYKKVIFSLSYLVHPLKLKLKKNFNYFFNFLKRKDEFSSRLLTKYFFYIAIKNVLFYLSFKLYDYFFYRFYIFLDTKFLLLNNCIFYYFSINKKAESHSTFYYLKENYKRELGRDIFDDRTYYDFFFYFFLYSLILNIEKSIYLFSGNKCLFFPSFYYYKKFPSFLSAKLINDFVLLELEKGSNMYRVFRTLQLYQMREKMKLKQELMVSFNKELFFSVFSKFKMGLRLKISQYKSITKKQRVKILSLFRNNKKNFFSIFMNIRSLFEELYYNEVLAKKYPLIGIRIECNGPPKRGRQARLVAYHQIVKNYKLFGKMPNKSILADIDYFQSFARTKQGSIGIKVWVFFYSKTYNANYKLISIV